MGYAFISYSTKNQQMADSFKTLFNQNGVETWMAPGDIPFGSTYTSTINRAIKGASCFVLLLSESAQGSQWVLKETERAVSTGKTIFTVMLDDVPLNDDFEFMLSTSQAVAIRKINKNDDNIKRLLQAVITYTGESKVENCVATQDVNNGMVNVLSDQGKEIDNESYFKENAVIEGTVLKHFKGRLSAEVVIPEGITAIGARAFAFYPELLGISIPSSVKKIEEYAFVECPKLCSITVNPQNPVFRSEGNCCIERATNSLLFGCYTSKIPDGVTVIGKNAFNGCKNLTSIIIPSSVTRIEESAFFQCTNLENISLSDGLTSIGDLAFCDCYSLIDLIIPANITKISGNAFYKCYGLESIQVNPNNSVYHSNCNCCIETNTNSLVLGCKNSDIPDGTVVIGEAAFGGCTGLKKIEIPSSVTEIGYEAFCGCEHLEKVVISVGVEKICTKAFMSCSALKELFIPASVSEIEAFAFSGCTSLRSIKVSSENSVYHSEDDCCIRSGDCVLILGCMNSIIPDGITEIGDHAFCDCYGLTDIYLPESITKIGKGAFSGSGLTSIEIPKHVEFIGSFAFHQCNELMSIIIPNSVKYIGELAFSGFDYASEKRDVFCETSKKPNRWHREWTDEDSVIHWKADWDYDENGIPVVKTSVNPVSDDKYQSTENTSSSILKTIELTVWSPVNTNVYLHDKKHLVMRIDHNTGFDYKHNTINVSGEFNLLFVSKGFEKTISFDASSVDDRLEYHLDAILSKKEIVASYDRDEALEQIEEEATAYAYAQLSKVGIVEDIPLLLAELKKLSAMTPKSQHINYLIACCASALGILAVKFGKLEDIRIILEVYEKYETKKSYGYMFEPIIQALHNEEGSISNDGVKEAPIEKSKGGFPIDFLTASPTDLADTPDSQQNVKRLNEILKSLNIAAHVTDTICGNSVTRYEVELHKGTRLRQLRAAEADIALQLGVRSVRVVTLLHELFKVGIEIPNHTSAVVSLRDVMNSPEFENTKAKLPIAVGKDIDGNCIVGDISRFPHLLIAGKAGSGKTVFLNSTILSLLYKASPEDVKLIMVDPKMVEHDIYNGIPHLLAPVIIDPKKAVYALQWAVSEMLRRYKVMSDTGVRNLETYNSTMINQGDTRKKLPHLVIIIDELSDLMLVAAKEAEENICRIAQLGRAAGIHLIIATQQLSTDVITGLMKANMPSRIAFAIPSSQGSRIILDKQGAETLVGQGDMLFVPIGSNGGTRVQGCFVSCSDVENVVSYIKAHQTANYDSQLIDALQKTSNINDPVTPILNSDSEKTGVVTAEMLAAAVDIILDAGQVSISLLQRRLHLGYMMSANIVDKMEEIGIVGGFQNGKPREILISKQQWETLKSNLSV